VGIRSIQYPFDWTEVNPENDNVDVIVVLDDGRQFTFVVATPNNLFWCMDNEGIDYYFGAPMLFVKILTVDNVERALNAIVNKSDSRWLEIYG